jgi:hypothetical protein
VLLAAEVAQASHTPLPVILGWGVDELMFWHATYCDLL